MKRYSICVIVKDGAILDTYTARNKQSACNKAIRRCQYITKDKTITLANVESVKYEGFYLARRFFAVE